MTFFPIRLWKPCMRIMEKLWGFSFQSNQANSPVRPTDSIIFLNHQSCYHRFLTGLAGSTDFGNVSYIIPGIHPFFSIGTDALNHTEEYTEAAGRQLGTWWNCIQWFLPDLCDAYLFSFFCSFFLFFCVSGSEKAQLFTLRTAKALAMTAVDVVCNPDLLAQVREDFSLAKLKMEEIWNLTVHQTDE